MSNEDASGAAAIGGAAALAGGPALFGSQTLRVYFSLTL